MQRNAPTISAAHKSSATHGASEPITGWALLKALRHCWRRALTVGMIAALIAAAGAWFGMPPPKKTARTLIRVPPDSKFLFTTAEARPDLGNHQRTQVALVKSRLVLNSALREPKVAQLSIVRDHIDPVDWLEKQVQSDFSIAPEILRIALSGDRADELMTLVNAIRDGYLKEVIDKERVSRNERLTMLSQMKQKLESQLRTRKEEQREFERKAGAKDAGGRAILLAFTYQDLRGAEREILQTRSELRKAKLELASLKAKRHKGAAAPVPDARLSQEVDQDPVVHASIMEIKRQQGLIQDTIKSSAQGEKDPSVAQYRALLGRTEKTLAALREKVRPDITKRLQTKIMVETEQSIGVLEARVALFEENEKVLNEDLNRLRAKVEDMKNSSIKLDAFQDDLSPLEAALKKMANEEEALKVELQAPSTVQVLEEATVTEPSPRNRKIVGAGVAGGGLFALVLTAFAFWELHARRIDAPEDAASGLGMKLLGVIPDSANHGMLTRSRPAPYMEAVLGESFDATRTVLLNAATTGELRVVMVTSAQSGEGKTSLATRLAASMAQIGRKTLLVDGDLRNPLVHRIFRLNNDVGFCELLRGESAMDEVVQATPVDNLWVIPAGNWNAYATRAIPQATTNALFGRWRSDFDFILIDTSPVLPVVDPLLIGQHADGALISVLCGVSQLKKSHTACQRLALAGVRTVGVVANGVRGEMYESAYQYIGIPNDKTDDTLGDA